MNCELLDGYFTQEGHPNQICCGIVSLCHSRLRRYSKTHSGSRFQLDSTVWEFVWKQTYVTVLGLSFRVCWNNTLSRMRPAWFAVITRDCVQTLHMWTKCSESHEVKRAGKGTHTLAMSRRKLHRLECGTRHVHGFHYVWKRLTTSTCCSAKISIWSGTSQWYTAIVGSSVSSDSYLVTTLVSSSWRIFHALWI